MLSIEDQAIFKKAKFRLGENTLAQDLCDYCVDFKLSIEIIQELLNHYSNQNDPSFYSEAQSKLNEKGITI